MCRDPEKNFEAYNGFPERLGLLALLCVREVKNQA